MGSGDSVSAYRQYKKMKLFEKKGKNTNSHSTESLWQLHNIDDEGTGWAFGDAARKTEESLHIQVTIPFKI